MQINVAEPFLPLFDPADPDYHKTYKVFWGGRGSGKTVTLSKALLVRGFRQKERILCCRQYQNSLSDSVLKTLEDEIYELGLQGFYEVQNSAVYGKNGTEMMFKGLHNNVQSIKSTAGVTITFIEEAQTVSEKSYEILIPTVLRTPSPEIWVAFNPDQESDPTYKRFITSPPPADQAYIRRVNYDENPYFPEPLRKEMEYLRRVDPDAHAHVWLGECRLSSEAQVLHGKWEIGELTVPANAAGPYLASDFGFASDPTTLVKCWIIGASSTSQGTLYVEHDFGKVGLEIRDTAAAFKQAVPDADKYTIYGDCARPETISHLVSEKLKVVGCDKWTGSVEDGIAFLRSFEKIVIHPRCKGTIQEARLYSYKTDPPDWECLAGYHRQTQPLHRRDPLRPLQNHQALRPLRRFLPISFRTTESPNMTVLPAFLHLKLAPHQVLYFDGATRHADEHGLVLNVPYDVARVLIDDPAHPAKEATAEDMAAWEAGKNADAEPSVGIELAGPVVAEPDAPHDGEALPETATAAE